MDLVVLLLQRGASLTVRSTAEVLAQLVTLKGVVHMGPSIFVDQYKTFKFLTGCCSYHGYVYVSECTQEKKTPLDMLRGEKVNY